jgi:predicted transcriptional regulator
MASLTPTESEILRAMEALGANKESSMKSVDQISVKANRPSGLVANALISLSTKKAVKRVLKDKAAAYYTTK